jgi:hypothetical protein
VSDDLLKPEQMGYCVAVDELRRTLASAREMVAAKTRGVSELEVGLHEARRELRKAEGRLTAIEDMLAAVEPTTESIMSEAAQ